MYRKYFGYEIFDLMDSYKNWQAR